VFIISFTYTDNHVRNDMRCFIETKQNQPTSWNKYIPVLDATHLLAFKPKQLTSNRLQRIDQHDITEVCAYVETFSTAFTSLPFVMMLDATIRF
jgi:hypothetical protein